MNSLIKVIDKYKLILGFAFLIVLSIFTGIYALTQIKLLGGLTVKMYNHPLTVTRASLMANVGIIKIHRSMKDVALAKDAESIQKALDKVNFYEKEVYKQYDIVTERILGKEGEALIAETIQIFKDWRPIRDEVIQHMKAGNRDAAAHITKNKGAKHVAMLDKNMDALVNYAGVKGAGFFDSAKHTAETSRNMTIAIISIATIIGIILAFLLNRSLVQRVIKLRTIIGEIAENSDLTRRIEVKSHDDIGQTASAFNSMLEKFETLIAQVNNSTTQLATSSEEVAAISKESSSNLEQQRTQTDQIATAMNEMAATVQEVANNASAAADAANQGNHETQLGRKIVEQSSQSIKSLAQEVQNAAEVIKGLEQESINIGSVLDVIKSIAEQTNLLALNAAIEAARAGEQGRGFAVVADEVRTLASRTQESTSEIQTMIEHLQVGSQNAVHVMEQGCTQANTAMEQASQAVASLDTIAAAVTAITDLNTQIASAAEEQSAVTEEMNKNVIEIHNVSEKSASGSLQTQEASAEMAHLASELQMQISQFNT